MAAVDKFAARIQGAGIGVKVDDRDQYSPGWKYNEWEKRGVPLRIEVGPRDLEKNQVMLVRRDNGEKTAASLEDLAQTVRNMLDTIQSRCTKRRRSFAKSTVRTWMITRSSAKSWMACRDSCGVIGAGRARVKSASKMRQRRRFVAFR